MTDERTWTYADITAEAERQIQRARSDSDAAQSEVVRAMNGDFAMGAYLFWMGLTEGTHNAADLQRLKTLARPPNAGK
jgi:hypothetical protein